MLLTAVLLAGLLGPIAAQAASAAADCSKGRVISFIAHIDDDLLFMNPSIDQAIDDGKCVRTVAITAGDAGDDETYWRGRENGQQAAYATMAGVANQWTPGDAGVAGRSIAMATNNANPKVSLVWMRLPDGNPNGAGYTSTGGVSLEQLWDNQVASLTAVDGSSTYTRAQLRQALAELMTDFGATEVKTPNFVDGGGDHSDHFAAARFAQVAAIDAGMSNGLTGYIGYPTKTRPVNVTGADRTAKDGAWYAYARFDRLVCARPERCAGTDIDSWLARQYSFGPFAPRATWSATNPTVQVGQTATFAYTCSNGSVGTLSALPAWITAAGTSVTASPTAAGPANVTVTCTDVVNRSGSATLTVTAERPKPPVVKPPAQPALKFPTINVKTPKQSKIKANINPDLPGSKSWKVQILKKKKGTLVKVKTLRTKGPREIVRIDVPRGRYVVRVPAQKGYETATSKVVRIRR